MEFKIHTDKRTNPRNSYKQANKSMRFIQTSEQMGTNKEDSYIFFNTFNGGDETKLTSFKKLKHNRNKQLY